MVHNILGSYGVSMLSSCYNPDISYWNKQYPIVQRMFLIARDAKGYQSISWLAFGLSQNPSECHHQTNDQSSYYLKQHELYYIQS